jgi:hypothetical protein
MYLCRYIGTLLETYAMEKMGGNLWYEVEKR